MLDDRDAGIRSHRSRAVGWVAWAFGLAGTAMLVWSAWQVEAAREYQETARKALSGAATGIEPGAGTTVALDSPDAVAGRVPPAGASTSRLDASKRSRSRPRTGAPLGTLTIPRLDVSVAVLHGTDSVTLKHGVGHIEHTAMPGAVGNVGLAGHRDTFFRPLRHVLVGDDVLLEMPDERIHYRVTSVHVVEPGAVDVLDPSPDALLTLVTCYPFGYFGPAPDRFVVRASRVLGDPGQSGVRALAPVARLVPATPDAANSGQQPPRPRRTDTARALDVGGEALMVRAAVDRFQQIYNTTAVRRGDGAVAGPLVFGSCDIGIHGEEANVRCVTNARANRADSSAWAFTLARIDRGWAIKAVVVQDEPDSNGRSAGGD